MQTHTVENLRVSGDLVMRSHGAVEHRVNIENAAYAANAGENAVFFGENGRCRAPVGIDAGVAGGVARRPVFEQSVFQNGGNSSAIPVHWGSCSSVLRFASNQHSAFI